MSNNRIKTFHKYLKLTAIFLSIIILVILLILLAQPGRILTAGDKIPEFRLKDLYGNDVFSNDFNGKVMLINFWATRCQYCIEELPHIEDFYNRYQKDGFRPISILKDTHNIDDAVSIAEKNSITYPILLDKDKKIFKLFGVFGLPYSVLIDRRGIIRYIHRGFNINDLQKYEKEINHLLQENI